MIFRRERWLCELLQVLEMGSKLILGISGKGLHPDPLSSKRFCTFLCLLPPLIPLIFKIPKDTFRDPDLPAGS